MMNNNFINMFMNLMQQGGQNPQAFANNLLQKNPNFARSLQGQNPRDLAMKELQRRGIDPNAFMQMFNGKK